MKAVAGHAEARPRAVPRARGVRDLRLRARRGVAGAARPGRPARRAAEAAAELADAGRGAGGLDLRRHHRVRSTTSRSTEVRRFEARAARVASAPATPACSPRSATPARCPTRRRARAPPWPTSRPMFVAGSAEARTARSRPTSTPRPWAKPSPTRRSRRSSSAVAGGQERILRRRIQRSSRQEDHARDGADRGEPDRAGPGAGAGRRCRTASRSPRSSATSPRPAARCRQPAARRPRRDPHGRARRASPPTAASCGGYNSSVIRAAEGEMKRASRELGRDYALVVVGRKAEGYFRYRDYRIDGDVHRLLRPAVATRTPARSPPPSREPFLAGEIDLVQLVYTRFVSAGTPGGRRAAADAARPRDRSPGGDGRPDAGRRRRRPAAAYEFEPEPEEILERLLPRYVEARIFAALLERGRVRARGPPAGDEGRDRQRRRPDHRADPRS